MKQLNDLKDKAAKVSDEKFGRENPAKAPMLKLVQEIDEVIECLDNGTDPEEEFADCLLLLIDAYRKYYGDDVPMEHLMKVASDKLDVVLARKWGEPDMNGVFQHIKEDKKPSYKTWGNINLDKLQQVYDEIAPNFEYEMIDAETRQKIKELIEEKVPEYNIKCNEENNPPEVVHSGHIWVRVSDKITHNYVDIVF